MTVYTKFLTPSAPAEALSPPLPVPAEAASPTLPAPAVTSSSSDDLIKPDMLGRFYAHHNNKTYHEEGGESMVIAVNILAHPETDADRKALIEEEILILGKFCSTESCKALQREFAAAKKIREGNAKTAEEALGLDSKPVNVSIQQQPPEPSHPQPSSPPSHVIDSMINAASRDNMAGVITAKETLGNPTKPERGNRKVARLKNKDGLIAMNAGNYKGALALFAEGASTDQSESS